MPRTARASQAGYCYHVLNRGNGRAEVFHKQEDDLAFVRLMGQASERLPLWVAGWCLMPNHFNLVLWPHGDGGLATGDGPPTRPRIDPPPPRKAAEDRRKVECPLFVSFSSPGRVS